jgi:hypothetical protein
MKSTKIRVNPEFHLELSPTARWRALGECIAATKLACDSEIANFGRAPKTLSL